MDVRQFLGVARQRWPVFVLVVLLSLGSSAIFTAQAAKTFQSGTKLFLSTTTAGSVQEAVSGEALAMQRIRSYSTLATTSPVLDRVYEVAGVVPGSDAQLMVVASPIENQLLIQVLVTASDPARARKVADAVGTVLPERISQLEPPNTRAFGVTLRVAEPALLSATPISPQPRRNLLLGLLLGIVVGVGVVLLFERLDTRVRSLEDLRAVTGTTPLLGAVKVSRRGRGRKTEPVFTDDQEVFRRLRTNVQFVNVAQPVVSLVVTSAVAAEGKTTVAINLARAMADAKLRVVVVDADLRRPTLTGRLGLLPDVGLTDVLLGRVQLDDVLQETAVPGLSVLAPGALPPNPSELLGSQAMAYLLAKLQEAYDVVILDAPPLLPVTDAAVLTTLASGALVVVKVNSTTKPELQRAMASLHVVDARIVGTVANFSPGAAGEGGYATSYERRPAPAPEAGVAMREVAQPTTSSGVATTP